MRSTATCDEAPRSGYQSASASIAHSPFAQCHLSQLITCFINRHNRNYKPQTRFTLYKDVVFCDIMKDIDNTYSTDRLSLRFLLFSIGD